MTYNPDIPQSEPSPAVQQPDLKTNFSQFAAIFSSTSGGAVYNHTPFNTGNQGKHESVLLEKQTLDPVIDNDFVAIYNKTDQIFLRIPQFIPNIPNDPMQLTCSTVNTAGPQYQSFMAGGFIVYFGAISGTTSSTANVTNIVTLSPAPSLLLLPLAASNTMTVGGTSQPCGIGTTKISASQFSIVLSSPWTSGGAAPYNITWFAIGRP